MIAVCIILAFMTMGIVCTFAVVMDIRARLDIMYDASKARHLAVRQHLDFVQGDLARIRYHFDPDFGMMNLPGMDSSTWKIRQGLIHRECEDGQGES